jgi:hypothetical protein
MATGMNMYWISLVAPSSTFSYSTVAKEGGYIIILLVAFSFFLLTEKP